MAELFCPNVRLRIDLLRCQRPLRKFITLASHKNLQRAADANPREIESLLLRLEQLHNVAIAPEGIVIPESASFPHNRTALRMFAKQGLGHLVELMGKEGVLDLRSIGLAGKLEGKHQISVRRVMDILRGERPLEELITPDSEKRLIDLAVQFPTEIRKFLKALVALHYRGLRLSQIVVPANLGETQNREVLKRLGSSEFLSGLIENGVLDLRKAGLKEKIRVRDLTEGFEDYKIMREVRDSYQGENLEFIKEDFEIREITLYQNLWSMLSVIYFAGEIRAAARAGKDPHGLEEENAVYSLVSAELENLAKNFPMEGVLLEIPEEFPFGENSPASRIARAAELFRKGNHPAAKLGLRTLAERLETEIGILETKRLERERATPVKRPENVIGESLLAFAKARHQISFDGGFWIIPEGKCFREGPAIVKKRVPHKVAEEKVVRREQHKYESISRKIPVNSDFKLILETLSRALRRGTGVNLDEMLAALKRTFKAYELGKVREKFRAKLMVKLAINLIRTAGMVDDPAGKTRLMSFAATACEMTARQLDILNAVLARQLTFIAPKIKLETEIIAQHLVRDTNLLIFSNSLMNSITNRRMMNDAVKAWILHRLASNARSVLTVDESTEPGIRRCAERIEEIRKKFARIGGMNQTKEKFRKAIIDARENYEEALRRDALQIVRENLAKITGYNKEIEELLRSIAREALLIRYEVEHKAQTELNTDDVNAYLDGQAELFEAIARAHSNYRIAIGSKGDVLGEAHPYDIAYFKWKPQEPG